MCIESGKQTYSKRDANMVVNAMRHNVKGNYLRSYPCPHCNGWHVTHKVSGQGGALRIVRLTHAKEFAKYLQS